MAHRLGRPFRRLPLDQFEHITVAQALKHPTWVMGRPITIDSATMLNKGLEIIEACRFFDLPPAEVRVSVHPQSTVHSMVEFVDGSILEIQISVTDMRLPILYALSYPERVPSELTFDLSALGQLNFEPPDFARFPCLRLAYQAAEAGGAACIALNAADEIAVDAFLEGCIPFQGIPRTIEQVLEATPDTHPETIQEVLQVDEEARRVARSTLGGSRSRPWLRASLIFFTERRESRAMGRLQAGQKLMIRGRPQHPKIDGGRARNRARRGTPSRSNALRVTGHGDSGK